MLPDYGFRRWRARSTVSAPNSMSAIARSASGTLSSESDLAEPAAECFYCGQKAASEEGQA